MGSRGVVLINPSTGEELKRLSGQRLAFEDKVLFRPGTDEDLVAIVRRRPSYFVIWVGSGGTADVPIDPQDRFHDRIYDFAFSPGGDRVVVALHRSGRSVLEVWDTADYRPVKTLATEPVTSVAWSADGRLIAAAARVIDLFDAQRGIRLTTLSVPRQAALRHMTISSDGKWLAAIAGRSLRVWEIASCSEVLHFESDSDLASVRMSPDMVSIATAATDGTILLWRMATANANATHHESLEALCSRLASDAKESFPAVVALAHSGQRAIDLLSTRMSPPDASAIDRLFADLDDDMLDRRQFAETRLGALRLNPSALEQLMVRTDSAEKRVRLARLLDRARREDSAPGNILELRGVYILERIGTPKARGIVDRLSQGSSFLRLTSESRSASARMESRGIRAPEDVSHP
jgi:hypothetical protein